MRNKNLIFVLIGAVLFGLLAATSVSQYLASVRAKNTLSEMVVAKVDIPLGARIVAEQLTTVQVPRAAMPEGTFTSLDQVPGRIAITKISAREPITASRLARVGAAGGLSAVIPEGYRAMTVKVDDETGIAGFLVPGTLVDVLAVISANGNQGPVSKIVLQNIKVLANGQNLDQPKDEREANSVKTVTLQVTPDESEKLALASAEGKLRLALRNSVDQADEATPGATRRSLLTGERSAQLELEAPRPQPVQAARPAPAPRKPVPNRSPASNVPARIAAPLPLPEPAKPKPAIEVFEGSKKRTVVFP